MFYSVDWIELAGDQIKQSVSRVDISCFHN